jgi:hypothetical protein
MPKIREGEEHHFRTCFFEDVSEEISNCMNSGLEIKFLESRLEM